jgi:hypothetical protein
LQWLVLSFFLLLLVAGTAHGQGLIANDDDYYVPLGGAFVVEPFGVLDNDILDGEAAGENEATAELVTDVSHGTLLLGSDGSFTYTPGATFDGTDGFVYRAVFGGVNSEASVTLSACTGGPEVFTCWKEGAFLAMAAAAGFPSFQEGFEDDAVWGAARSPASLPRVSSRGFEWRANDFDPTHLVSPFPPSLPPNEIMTGSGPARTGMWGIFDIEHGYSPGSEGQCDTEFPDAYCFYHDGMTVAAESGTGPFHGVGGYFAGSGSADVAIVVDADWENPIGGGPAGIGPHRFFGIIDIGPLGFSEVQFREVDGRVSDAFFIFADDFTILAEPVIPQVAAMDDLSRSGLGILLLVAGAAALYGRRQVA